MKHKFISISIALVLALSLCLVTAVPVAAQEELNVYGYGNELYVADGSADWAEINIPVDVALGDIDELEFREMIESYTPNGWSVNVLLGIDADGDDVFEADVEEWHVGTNSWTLAALNGDTFVQMDGASGNPAKGVWTETDALSVAQWWTPDESGAGFAKSDEYPFTFYGSFADFINVFVPSATQTSLIRDTEARVLCVKLLIGGSGSWMDETAFVDEVTINGETYYLTIQRAVDSASPSGTVTVAAGAYTEDVLVDVEGVTVRGESLDAVVTGEFMLKADSITIDGLTIKKGILQRAIFTNWGTGGQTSKGHRIINNDIIGPNDGTTCWGINLATPDVEPVTILVDNNKIHGWRVGIMVEGYGNTITNNEIYDGMFGIELEKTNDNVIIYNDIHDNFQGPYNKAGHGVGGSGGVGNLVNYNDIYDNEFGINSTALTELDATNNWWGNPNGPSAVSGVVDYSPWLPGTWQTYYDPLTGEEIDTDEDGFSDLEEYWLGTDFDDPDSKPGAPVGDVDTAYVEGDGQANLQDSEGDPIADVDISGGGDASGTITGARYTEDPSDAGLSVGTGTSGVVFLDVKVTGYTEGMARITVPYPDDPEDGIVDDTDPPILETTLGLYYWDDATVGWLIADNNVVHTIDNTVSGDIPITALTGTPVGMGGYLEDEATVAIESILNLSNKSNPLSLKPDTVELTINTNTAFLGSATIDLIFDPTVVEVLGVEGVGEGDQFVATSDFDSLRVNLNYDFVNNNQIVRFLAYQSDETGEGVDATGGGAVVAVVKLKAVGSTMDFSPLHLEVDTLKDNKYDRIPLAPVAPSFAVVGGVGDANRDTYVDPMDLVEIECAILDFPGYSIDTPTMNVDGKDDVDAADCSYLARHLIGVSDHPLPPLGWMPPWGS